MDNNNDTKKYLPCDKVLELYPSYKYCDRPVLNDGQNGFHRCDLHPIKNIWSDINVY